MISKNILCRQRSLLMLSVCVILGACGVITNPSTGPDNQALSPCTAKDSAFADLPFSKWSDTYNTTVAQVIEAHLQSLQTTGTAKLTCTAPNYASMVQPTDQLKSLAGKLAPWKDTAKLQTLSETELGPVLLEYLRVYECALNEQEAFMKVRNSGGNLAALKDEWAQQMGSIQHELALARPSLDKTLQIVGGQDRLRPLALDIECLKRTSLDIRNILGLVSQASMCLPKIRDARGSLRDLPDVPTQ